MTTDDSFLDDHTFLGDGQPDTLDQRLARELPDEGNGDVPFQRQPDAVGELVAEPHEGEDEDELEEQDVLAQEAGPARQDAPAEQAAMHVMDLEAREEPEEDFSAFVSDADEDEDEEDEDSEEDLDETEDEDDRERISRDDTADEFVYDSEWDDDRVSPDDET
ncbi:MAG: hypothetical protein Q4G64_01130 [bacterium]|nr:hypothetical protein [bacterium]